MSNNQTADNQFEVQQRAINLIHRYTLSTLLALTTRSVADQERVVHAIMDSISADAVGAMAKLQAQGAISKEQQAMLATFLAEEAATIRDWAVGTANASAETKVNSSH